MNQIDLEALRSPSALDASNRVTDLIMNRHDWLGTDNMCELVKEIRARREREEAEGYSDDA